MVEPGIADQKRAEWSASWHIPLISALGIGVSMIPVYSLGALMPAIHASTGWTRSAISGGVPFLSAGAILLSPLAGLLVDRFGSRRVAIPGLVFFCAALASLALTSNRIGTWWLSWAAIATAEVFVKVMVWTAAVVTRFQHARGTAVGVALTGTGLASICLPYLTTILQETYGWRAAYATLAGGGFLIVFPLVCFFFFDANDALRRTASAQVDRSTLPGLSLRETLPSRHYLQMALAALLSATAGTGLTVHFVPILRSAGLSAHSAAATAGGIGVALIVGGLGGGYLLDKFSGPAVGFVALAAPMLACPILLLWHTPAAGFAAAFLIGGSAGAEINVYASIIPRYFGVRHFGLLFSLIDAIITVGLGIGPFTAGYLFDRFGNYNNVLLLSVPLFLVSAILLGTLGHRTNDPRLVPAPVPQSSLS